MTTYVEAEHPRALDGRFTEKEHSAPELELTVEEYDKPPLPSYDFPESKLPIAIAQINKANRRLERYGIEERFEYETESYIRSSEHTLVAVSMVKLTLNRPRISAGDWEFVSAHETTADGRIVSYGELTAENMRCEHCGHKRQRGKVFTVRHRETGETVQVGSNCIAKFLGVRPAGLWALEFEPEAGSEEEEDELDSERTFRAADIVVPARNLILVALAASNEGTEFISRNQATTKHPATASVIHRDLAQLLEAEHPAEREKLADEVLAWVNAQPDDNDYIRNLRTVLAGDERWVRSKHFALAASAVSAYQRSLVQREERREEEEAYTPGFIAPVGERVRDVPVEVLRTRIFHGEYGPTTLITMRAADGKTVKWFASGNHSHLKPGGKMTMTATVKEHGNFRGKDETSVSRAKLVPAADEG